MQDIFQVAQVVRLPGFTSEQPWWTWKFTMQWKLMRLGSLEQALERKLAVPPARSQKAAVAGEGKACLISWCKGTGHSVAERKIFLGHGAIH